MKTPAFLTAILLVSVSAAFAQSQGDPSPPVATADTKAVAPALERYGHDILADKLWKRPGLSIGDRSIVTLTALIARNQERSTMIGAAGSTCRHTPTPEEPHEPDL